MTSKHESILYISRPPAQKNAERFAIELGCHDLAYVDVTAGNWCSPQMCLSNVWTAVELLGGEGRLGYLLWEIWGGLCLTAEPHCIWFVGDEYRELTPQDDGTKVCFSWSGEILKSFEDFQQANHIIVERKVEATPLVQHPLIKQASLTLRDISEMAGEIGNRQGVEASHRYHRSRIGEVRRLVEQYHSLTKQGAARQKKEANRRRKKADRQRRRKNRR